MKAAAFGVVIALVATPVARDANAFPLLGTLVIEGTTGPQAGVNVRGAFTVDSSILTIGSGQMTSLDLTWNGVHYTQPSSSFVEVFSQPTEIGNAQFIAGTGIDRISLDYDLSLPPGDQQPAFTYEAPGGTFFGNGFASLNPGQLVPEPASLALLGVGLLGLVAARSRR